MKVTWREVPPESVPTSVPLVRHPAGTLTSETGPGAEAVGCGVDAAVCGLFVSPPDTGFGELWPDGETVAKAVAVGEVEGS
jgi:hypothetical protein